MHSWTKMKPYEMRQWRGAQRRLSSQMSAWFIITLLIICQFFFSLNFDRVILFEIFFWPRTEEGFLHCQQTRMYSTLAFSQITLQNKVMLCILRENKWFPDQRSTKESSPHLLQYHNFTCLKLWRQFIQFRIRPYISASPLTWGHF